MPRLELRRETSGLRHYLEGRPVHAGSGLELELDGGQRVLGRYEWSFQVDDKPAFYLSTATGGQVCIWLPENAPMRWPETEAW